MKKLCIMIAALTLVSALGAEEVLSSEPVLITPKRIETHKSTTPAAGRVGVQSRAAAPAGMPSDMEIKIDQNRVLLKIEFKKDSIKLSASARRALRKLGLKPGQSLRISGLGDSPGSMKGSNTRLANLRARVIASYLEEFVGELKVELQWNARPPQEFAGFGAIIEGRD